MLPGARYNASVLVLFISSQEMYSVLTDNWKRAFDMEMDFKAPRLPVIFYLQCLPVYLCRFYPWLDSTSGL